MHPKYMAPAISDHLRIVASFDIYNYSLSLNLLPNVRLRGALE